MMDTKQKIYVVRLSTDGQPSRVIDSQPLTEWLHKHDNCTLDKCVLGGVTYKCMNCMELWHETSPQQ